MKSRDKLILIFAVFLACWFLPVSRIPAPGPVGESLSLLRWYAREHVLLCLVPAFFIAGAIGVFVRRGSVLKYLGPRAPKTIAYPVAAVSGTILAVCSCTVLPLFAGIYKRGAGVGPATAFLYAGPAINVLAIILTARVLGVELGAARAAGAIVFALVIGLLMHLFFLKDEKDRAETAPATLPEDEGRRALWQDALYFFAMVGVLVFANWGRPAPGSGGAWAAIHSAKWILAGVFAAGLAVMIAAWFDRRELRAWVGSSRTFALQILPLLFAGVVVAGLLLGGPEGGRGIVPRGWIEAMVGGNSPRANLFASLAGAFMYFATLTEVPILEGLTASGMGKGPSLALLLSGPAISLPNMLVIRSVLGTKKTGAYIGLVVLLSTIAGLVYGSIG